MGEEGGKAQLTNLLISLKFLNALYGVVCVANAESADDGCASIVMNIKQGSMRTHHMLSNQSINIMYVYLISNTATSQVSTAGK